MTIPLLGPLFAALFEFLKCLILYLLGALLALLVTLGNLILATLVALIGPVLGLLPTVDLGSSGLGGLSSYVGWANYFLPVSFGVSLAVTVFAVLGAWTVVKMILRRLGVG